MVAKGACAACLSAYRRCPRPAAPAPLIPGREAEARRQALLPLSAALKTIKELRGPFAAPPRRFREIVVSVQQMRR